MADPAAQPAAGRFGTFAGVFTPNVLTILGIILFLRTGWVVGQAGLAGALAIIALANAISFLTGLSLSSIATSMNVKAGGNYYLISRSLGLEIGGAIGIPLYLSQAISVAFYVIGFTEAMSLVPVLGELNPQLLSAGVVLLFVGIAYVGADFALKIQYGILAILVAALLSFFTGGWGDFVKPNLAPQYTDGISFWVVFAVFFPAVTGIEVGISLSGDLKDASKSIPRGTIWSILVTAVVYVGAAVWFAFRLPAQQLIEDTQAMAAISSVPVLILAGVAASTLSSALGSVLAAPRTLQATAMDRVTPRWMAAQLGSPTEPRVAVLITGAVALAVVALGDLDVVAPVITMFFLNTYGMVNLVAATERLVGNPSYRPRFKVPLWVSMAGAVGCYAAMFLIHAPATVAAIVVSYGIYFGLRRRGMVRTWGDVRSGIWTSLARYALLQLERRPPAVGRNWRPNLVVFTGQPHNRERLVALAGWLSLGRGIVTFVQLITGQAGREERLTKLRERAEDRIRTFIEQRNIQAFAEAAVTQDFVSGAVSVAQTHGIGKLESNTVLLGWSDAPAGRATLLRLLRRLAALEKSVLFLNVDDAKGFGERRVINVWWGGRGGNADLMVLLGYLTAQHRDWDGAELRLTQVVDHEAGAGPAREHLASLLEDVRVEATTRVVVKQPDQSIHGLFAQHSQDVDLTVLGLHVPDADGVEAYGERVEAFAEAVGTVLLVYNAQHAEDLL